MALEDLGRLVTSTSRDELARELEEVANASGVSAYDLEQYGGQSPTTVIDLRLYETIMQRARVIPRLE